jgi:hypothetical protein
MGPWRQAGPQGWMPLVGLARSDHPGVCPVCVTLCELHLAAGETPSGSDLCPRCARRHGRLIGPGAGQRTPLHELPSCLEPGDLVEPPGEPDTLGLTPHAAGATGGHHCAGGGRYSGTPPRAEDPCQGLLSGCGPLDPHSCHPLFRAEMGHENALGAGAMESAGGKFATPSRVVQQVVRLCEDPEFGHF